MIKAFEPVTLSWAGTDYLVPADDVLLMVAKVEMELKRATGKNAVAALLDQEGGGPSFAALSMAFGAALKHAGADVTAAEVYLTMQDDMASNQTDAIELTQQTIIALLSIVSPPIVKAMEGMVTDEKKGKASTEA